MPYKDKDRVRQYQRDWVRQKRGKGSTTNVTPLSTPSTPMDELKAKYDVRQGDYKPEPPRSIYDVPRYDSHNKPEPGTMVRVFRGKWIEVPYQEVDADGNAMPT